jgi:hypothetical protein
MKNEEHPVNQKVAGFSVLCSGFTPIQKIDFSGAVTT